MMTNRLIILFASLLLSACSSAPPIKYYVLTPVNLPAASTEMDEQLAIGVGPVSIPSLLDRKKILTRMPDNSIQIAEFHQWAAPLQDIFAETLVDNLSSAQPKSIFRTYPWNVHGTVNLQIIVDVLRFDSTPGESATLEANWTIKNEKTQKTLKTGKTVLQYSLPDSSYPATVHSLSLLLSEFSQELLRVILKLAK